MHSREALDRPIPPQIKEFRQRGQAQHGCLHTVQAQQTPRPRPTGPAREQRHGGSVTVCHGERRQDTRAGLRKRASFMANDIHWQGYSMKHG